MKTKRLLTLALAMAILEGGSVMAETSCRAIDGVDALFLPGRIILVGEVHGTREMPQLFVDLVCHAAKKGLAVAVGFEQPPAAGGAIQRYLGSPGTRADRFRILEPRVPFGDGSASEAMMDAFESLRKLAVETRRITVFGFAGLPPGKGNENGNVEYANTIAAARKPDAVVLAFMGSYHNRLTREPDDGGAPVGLLLRQRRLDLKSIYLEFTSGSAYNRGVDGPGIHAPTALQMGGGKPWTVLPAPSAAYDLVISVGEIHPSLPATLKQR